MKNINSTSDLEEGMYLYMEGNNINKFFKTIQNKNYSILTVMKVYIPKYDGKYDALVKVPWNSEPQILTLDILKKYCKIISIKENPEYFL